MYRYYLLIIFFLFIAADAVERGDPLVTGVDMRQFEIHVAVGVLQAEISCIGDLVSAEGVCGY